MNEPELLRELSIRSGLPESAAALILQSLRDLIRDGRVDPAQLATVDTVAKPAIVINEDPRDPGLVEALIARAKRHPLGLEFLASGLLASVAIALGAHAFTVEAARARLHKEREAEVEEPEEITVA